MLDYVAAAERHGDLIAGTKLQGKKKRAFEERDGAGGHKGAQILIGDNEAELHEYDALGVSADFVAAEIEAKPEAKRKFVDGMEVISRQEAIARGLDTYFTGEPCVNGHVADRSLGGTCAACRRELLQDPAYRARKRERQRELLQDPADRERQRERQREWQREWQCKRMQDPAYRARKRERQRELLQDPAYREQKREWWRERMQDPAYREQKRAKDRERMQDPAYRERRRKRMQDPAYLERRRERRLRIKQEKLLQALNPATTATQTKTRNASQQLENVT